MNDVKDRAKPGGKDEFGYNYWEGSDSINVGEGVEA